MTNSPALNAELRTPLETIRDLMDKVELLARGIADSTQDGATESYLRALIDGLPFDELTSAESAHERHKEEQETREYFADSKAMYRQPA